MTPDDTIVAISSAVGVAPRMLVRTSGPLSRQVAGRLGADLAAGLSLQTVHFQRLPMPAMVLHFPAGRSPTGQDVVEYHLPGNPLLCRLLVDELVTLGCRRAEAGEFTARAFFAGRLDLAQAEGVAATIAAAGEAELAAARQLAGGELSRRLEPIMNDLGELLALTEVGIDFTEEQVTFLSPDESSRRLEQLDGQLTRLLTESIRLEDLRHEPTVVLAGRPNAGKSTLLNALAGQSRAVVSPVAGTTRDVLSAAVTLPGGVVRVLDVAGIEAAVEQVGEIDRQMRQRALRAVEQADVVVLVLAADDVQPPLDLPRKPDVVVMTKIDLDVTPHPSHLSQKHKKQAAGGLEPAVRISVHERQGLETLAELLSERCFASGVPGQRLALAARHVEAIARSREALARAVVLADAGPELLAVELRLALDALGDVLGRLTPDDVLGRVFARFCIGK